MLSMLLWVTSSYTKLHFVATHSLPSESKSHFFCWHFICAESLPLFGMHLHRLQKFPPKPAPCQPTGTSTSPFMQ